MFIFRMEDKNGVGPYSSGKIGNVTDYWFTDHIGLRREYRNAIKNYDDSVNYDDCLLYHCATRSLEEFLFWFPCRYLSELSSLGNDLVIFKVNKNKVIFGKQQILFRKQDANEIKRIAPTHYKFIQEYEARN